MEFSIMNLNQMSAVQEKVLIDWVISGSETKGWIHTHGMDKFGLPELEIRSVPSFLAEPAAALLRHVSDYMRKPGVTVRVGETMETSPRTRFRFVKSAPILGEEHHYIVERWQIVELDDQPCDTCGSSQT
jgi:hypothetical protein